MRKIFLLFVLSLYSATLLKISAQDHYLDSLNNLFIHSGTDTGKVSALSRISKYYFQRLNKKDTAILIAKRCLLLASHDHLTGWQVKIMILLGDQYNYHQKKDSARLIYLQALLIAGQGGQLENEVIIMDGLADASHDTKQDSTLYWTNKAIALARADHLLEPELNVLLKAMDVQTTLYIRDSSLSFLNRSLEISGLLKSGSDSTEALLVFANAQDDAGNYPIALQKYLAALEISRREKNSFKMAATLLLIGGLYYEQENYSQALAYQYEALRAAAIPGHSKFWQTCFALGLTYAKLRQQDSARLYAEKAHEYTVRYLHFIPPTLLDDLGLIYYDIGDDSLALNYLQQCYRPLVENGDDRNICEAAFGLAQVFKKMGKTDSSIYYARQTLWVGQRSGKLKYISDASGLLADYFKKKNQIDSAFFYQQIGIQAYDGLYNREKLSQFQNLSFAEQQRQADIASTKKAAEARYLSNLKIYSLAAALFIFLTVTFILTRNNRQRRKAYNLLQKQKQETDFQKATVERTLGELRSTQSQLIQSEKMASLGELTAGIAHEIQNPLNFVNNFSEVNKELIEELRVEKDDPEARDKILSDIDQNLDKVIQHGKRADAIVKGMLQHSRSSAGVKELADINALTDEYLRISYHGLRAKDNSFNVVMQTEFDPSIRKINIIPQDLGRVLLNLYNNAFYAVSDKKKSGDPGYEPTVSISTKREVDKIEIAVKDNGKGIPANIVDKIFQPFFTTKPTGQGTGLGLSLSYDIIKAHGGKISVNTKEGEFTEFVIQLPISA
jgi:two-component system, NtrC family, sensor kinase